HEEASWHHLLSGAKLELDGQGRPILQVRSGDRFVAVGITRENVLANDAPREIVQELLVARLREQLKNSRAPQTSEAQLRRDWKLLKGAFTTGTDNVAAHNQVTEPEIPGSMD